MKAVASIDKMVTIINSPESNSFYQKDGDKLFRIDIITLLNMKLIDIITMIKEKRLLSTYGAH